MEKPLYPSPYMRITQGYNEGTHLESFAIDEAGSDTGIDNILAPYTGIIKKIYTTDANEVWFESLDKVEYPDGTIDYMTMLFAHDNDVSDLHIGKIINRGDILYQEGTKGNATGNHCHLECGRGKFYGTGWHKTSSNTWVINNGKNPTECLWIDDSIKILDSHNYTFRKIEKAPIPTPVPSPSNEDTEILDDPNESKGQKKLIFTCKTDDIYAIKLKAGQKLYLE